MNACWTLWTCCPVIRSFLSLCPDRQVSSTRHQIPCANRTSQEVSSGKKSQIQHLYLLSVWVHKMDRKAFTMQIRQSWVLRGDSEESPRWTLETLKAQGKPISGLWPRDLLAFQLIYRLKRWAHREKMGDLKGILPSCTQTLSSLASALQEFLIPTSKPSPVTLYAETATSPAS